VITFVLAVKLPSVKKLKNMDNLMSLWSFISLVSPLLIFLASCYYLSKSAKIDSALLFTGSGIGLLVSIFFSCMPYFVQSRYMPIAEASKYYAIAGFISFFGGICFAIGFFILISNSVNVYKQNKM